MIKVTSEENDSEDSETEIGWVKISCIFYAEVILVLFIEITRHFASEVTLYCDPMH